MKKTQKLKASLNDFLIESLQNYWYVSVKPKRHIRPSRTYELSAGNIREITSKYVSLKWHRFYIFPSFIKINFVDIEEIKRYIKRKKTLTNMEILDLNNRDSKVRRIQARKAAVMKWSVFVVIIAAVALISTLIALLLTLWHHN